MSAAEAAAGAPGSAAAAAAPVPRTPSAAVLPAVLAVARVEGRRLLLHPFLLASVGLFAAASGFDRPETLSAGRTSALGAPVFALGVPALLAAWRCATRPARDGAEELLAATPAPTWARTAGLLLAGLGPAVVACLLAAGVALRTWAQGGPVLGVDPVRSLAPELGEYLAVPVTLLGATSIAVAAARWSPLPGVGYLVAACLVLWTAWMQALAPTGPWFGFYVERLHYLNQAELPGDADWHAAFLAALTGLAAVAALLRDVERRRPLLATGAALGALAVVAGVAQLP